MYDFLRDRQELQNEQLPGSSTKAEALRYLEMFIKDIETPASPQYSTDFFADSSQIRPGSRELDEMLKAQLLAVRELVERGSQVNGTLFQHFFVIDPRFSDIETHLNVLVQMKRKTMGLGPDIVGPDYDKALKKIKAVVDRDNEMHDIAHNFRTGNMPPGLGAFPDLEKAAETAVNRWPITNVFRDAPWAYLGIQERQVMALGSDEEFQQKVFAPPGFFTRVFQYISARPGFRDSWYRLGPVERPYKVNWDFLYLYDPTDEQARLVVIFQALPSN